MVASVLFECNVDNNQSILQRQKRTNEMSRKQNDFGWFNDLDFKKGCPPAANVWMGHESVCHGMFFEAEQTMVVWKCLQAGVCCTPAHVAIAPAKQKFQ